MRELTVELLRDTGLQVDTAENARVAVEQAGITAYDLILMDMRMPEMDGLEATRTIRDLAAYRHVPILAMTANAFDEDRRACLEAGMDDFMPKPIVPETLYTRLWQWLAVHPTDPL